MGKSAFICEPGKQEVRITRTFDASAERVFKASTDPKLMPQWWGPRRFVTSVDAMDVRSGGIWRFVHHAKDGSTFGFHGVYHDVVAPSEGKPGRVVNTFEFEGMPGHVLLETTTFEEHSGKTTLTVVSVYQSVADRDGMVGSGGMEEGINESYDRLDELLAKG